MAAKIDAQAAEQDMSSVAIAAPVDPISGHDYTAL
jgi:hypothetical protein